MTVNESVLSVLRDAPFSLTPAEIADRTTANRNSIRRAVRELLASGRVQLGGAVIGNSATYKLA